VAKVFLAIEILKKPIAVKSNSIAMEKSVSEKIYWVIYFLMMASLILIVI
jgi:hypothetical protein